MVKLKRNLADHKRSERAKALAEAEAKERKVGCMGVRRASGPLRTRNPTVYPGAWPARLLTAAPCLPLPPQNLNRRERPPHPVQLFIEATWADFFTGLGQGAHVPKVMRHDGRVYNRWVRHRCPVIAESRRT